MKELSLENDIPLLCVTADSFPEGILPAFDKLRARVPGIDGRTQYGISRPDNARKIIYKAAAEALSPEESSNLGLESFVIKKGNYISIDIPDFMKNTAAIGKAFEQLLADKRIDPEGACVERYMNATDVKCMVKIS